jgi:hypothetical protein
MRSTVSSPLPAARPPAALAHAPRARATLPHALAALAIAAALLAACSERPSALPASAPPAAAPAPAAPGPAAPDPAAPAAGPAAPAPPTPEGPISVTTPDPCFLRAADVSAALGATYGEGVALAAIPGVPSRACTYDGRGASQLRVNVTAHPPARADALRAQLGAGLAGATAPLPGDADGAVFQRQDDLGTCALHYVRGPLQVEVRLMTCPDPAAQSKLARLPRAG